MKDKIIEFGSLAQGLYVSQDTTKAPSGSARTMTNARVTDRGGISKRRGVELIGDFNASTEPCHGFDIFVKTDVVQEIPVKAYNGQLEYYSPKTLSWELLKDGYTANKDFGFVNGFASTGNVDRLYMGNAYEDDQYWTGVCTVLTADLALLDTEVEVESVFRDDIYLSDTSIASSATTIQATAENIMADDQWINSYVYIKTGVHAGKIRKITDTDGTTRTITFDTLGTTPGLCDYEIRFTDFPATGTIVVNGNEIAYTAIPTYNTFTIAASTVTATTGDGVTSAIIQLEGNPRGNRMVASIGRRILGNVRSGINRDSTGTYGGAFSLGIVYSSQKVNALFLTNNYDSFEFSDPRVAGEANITSTQYGGAGVVDLIAFNNKSYIFKTGSIESLYYTEDENDVAVYETISSAYGAISRPIQGQDDVYFITSDKQLTSLGIVKDRGADKELATNIGIKVKRFLQNKSYDRNSKGAFFENRVYIPYKDDEDDTATNGVLVYSQDGRFEGNWNLNVNNMNIFDGDLCGTSSVNANAYKLETGLNDVLGEVGDNTTAFPISFEWVSNRQNLTSSNFNLQEVSVFACEGYIKENTRLDFSLYKDFEEEPFLDFSFFGTDSQVDEDTVGSFLGEFPLGSEPLSAVSEEEDADGLRHFMFIVYFPPEHMEHFSWGVRNSGIDEDFEIIRGGAAIYEDTIHNFGSRVKSLS